MIKTKFLKPYTHTGKTTLKFPAQKSGVYLIKENTKIVYIGSSRKNLYKTLFRHFENWNHKAQEVTNYNTNIKKYTYRAVFCSAIQAHILEKVLIKKMNPRDNKHTHSEFNINMYAKRLYDLYSKTPAI